MHTFSFEKLNVWQESKEVTKFVYKVTSTFPADERFSLISQLRRSSVSICANIAEGSTRTSYKDKAHFTSIAYGSAIELISEFIIAYELEYLTQEDYSRLRTQITSIANKLNALRNSQLSKCPNRN